MKEPTQEAAPQKACLCQAMYTHDHCTMHEHCKRYFRPDGWTYEKSKTPVSRPSLILRGWCQLCGGSIHIGYPIPETCREAAEQYAFLIRLLQTWRPYTVHGPGEVYPAAVDRMLWYQAQEERLPQDWARLMVSLLPEGERRDARLWAAGWLAQRDERLKEAWPVGRVARFQTAGTVSVCPCPGEEMEREIPVCPWQELLITAHCPVETGLCYSGLIRWGRERFYVERVPDTMLYSPAQWANLLPELLKTNARALHRQDFPPADSVPTPELLYVLDRLSNGHAQPMAVSPSPELLREEISRDIARQVIRGSLPLHPAAREIKVSPSETEGCCYRYQLQTKPVAEYRVTRVPYVDAQTLCPIPEGKKER